MALTNKVAFALLADLKADLSITDSATDTALERRILSASAQIERYCNRPFRREVGRIERLAGYGTVRLLPALTPIVSVANIEYDGAVIPATEYEIEVDPTRNEGWAIYGAAGWYWTAPGAVTTAERLQPLPGQEHRKFIVTYTGGYGCPNDSPSSADPQLPVEITEACLLQAAHLWKQRGRDGNVVGESVGEASVQYGFIGGVDAAPRESHGIPASIAAMLDAFKRAA